MQSRQRALSAVNHEEPDRCPVFLNRVDDIDYWRKNLGITTDDDLRTMLGCDFRKNSYSSIFKLEEGKTVWGIDNNWDAGYNSLRSSIPFKYADTIAQIESYKWPTADNIDYNLLKQIVSEMDPQAARILSLGFLPPFDTVLDLFGMEEGLIALYECPEVIEAALAHIGDYLYETTRRALQSCAADVDFFWMGDDFSSQRGMMISPLLWRKLLLPIYKRIFGLVKSYSVKVWFHSCGTFRPVMDDLIDAGMDVWETVQAHLPGNEPAELKREYGAHITFYGGINSQETLPFGTTEDVRREVRERFKVFGKGGGYICGVDHSIQRNIPAENIVALYDEAKKCIYG